MAGALKPDTLNAKVRTCVVGGDYRGSLDKGIEVCFSYVSTPARRLALLDKLHAMDKRLTAWEQATAAKS